MWNAEGMTAGQISRALGEPLVSRNSIIGIVSRRGWTRNPILKEQNTTLQNHRQAALMRANRSPAVKAALQPPRKPADGVSEVLATDVARVPLMALTASSCRWTDCEGEEWLFCGAVKVPGLPYCRTHAQRSYQPSRVRA